MHTESSTTESKIEALQELKPIHFQGMGAIVLENHQGVGFRVWAPNAQEVKVEVYDTSSNCGENEANVFVSTSLQKEAEAYWSIVVPEAKERMEYKFLLKNGEEWLRRSDPYEYEFNAQTGCSIIHNPESLGVEEGFEIASWNELVIYQLHIGAFAPKQPGERNGTFEDTIAKIPYLKRLGINAVQLLPVSEFPGNFSWGYDGGHPFAIERAYGGPLGFAKLLNAFHKAHIAVIVDVVYNHFGPMEMDLWRFDGWFENDLGGIYFYNDERAETPWGHTRPDYGRAEVCNFLLDNLKRYIEVYKVDGIRLDATKFIRNYKGDDAQPEFDSPEGIDFLKNAASIIHNSNRKVLSIAEDLGGLSELVSHPDQNGYGFSTQWDGNFVFPLREFIAAPFDEGRDMQKLESAVAFRYTEDAFSRLIYTESHDEVANGKNRVIVDIDSEQPFAVWSKKRAVLGSIITLTSPGIPMIFMGQEFLEDQFFHDDKPLDWSKTEKFSGLILLYKELIKLRTNAYGTTYGLIGQHCEVLLNDNDSKVIAFLRMQSGLAGDATLVVLNCSGIAQENIFIPCNAGVWRVRFNSDWEGFDEEFGNTEAFAYESFENEEGVVGILVGLDAYTGLILSQDN